MSEEITTTEAATKITIEVKDGMLNLQWQGVSNPLEVCGLLELAKVEALSYLYEVREEKANGLQN